MTALPQLLHQVDAMLHPSGFDVIIVCASNQAAENYWQQRLESSVKLVANKHALILAVHEDWNASGAGNGLGTLYAVQKAVRKAKDQFNYDLMENLKRGASVALYHTAGKGTRLAPLPGAENNNKPGVKLPSLLEISGKMEPMTILEAVIRQTSAYAAVRGGRLSVFWGDQVFVPSAGIQKSEHAADILAAMRDMPSAEEWERGKLHQYGLIAVTSEGNATQLEKVTYDVAMKYLPPNVIKVGTSLGSFSMNAALTEALIDEFANELTEKKVALDSDPHFWMPLTLRKADYISVMIKKGDNEMAASSHFERMSAFKAKFQPDKSVLGCVDVGADGCWWDYGRGELYRENNLLVTEENDSAQALRRFLGLQSSTDKSTRRRNTTVPSSLDVDESAVLLNCRIKSGRVGPGCVLVNVTAPSVDVETCILMQVTSKGCIQGKGGILYNVVHESSSNLSADAIRADVFMPGKKVEVKSRLDIDGGKAWKISVEGNEMSFEECYKANLSLDVRECIAESAAVHARVAAHL